MKAMEILQDIRSKIGKRDIFNYNRDQLIKCLITAVNDVAFSSSIFLRNDITDGAIEQFRAILKFIFEYSSNDNPLYDNPEDLTHIFVDMVMEFDKCFTPVRNYLEQCETGMRKLLYDEKNNLYYEDSFNKFANYSRIRDRVVKDSEKEFEKYGPTMSMISYWKNNPKKQLFKDRFYKSLMEDYIKICWDNSEIKFDYQFVDFKYSELITFCAALLLIGGYYFINQVKYFYGYIDEEEMRDGIRRLTDLDAEKVDLFLKYSTYDYEYQKDKLTLIQSLIKGKNGYYFLAYNLMLGKLPIKMCRSIFDNDHDKYEKDISAIAKLKEGQMTNEIVNTLKKYDYLDIKTDYQLKNKDTNKIDAEYDILIYDNKESKLYITECKWFYIGDDEFEHIKLENKINKAILYRLDKNKIIKDSTKSFVKEVFDKDNAKVVEEFLISQNNIGMKKHEMPVIDFDTLKLAIDENDSFEGAMNYIYEEKYLNSIEYEGVVHNIEIEGYKFKIYRIVGKYKFI